MEKSIKTYDITVIGGGPAGYTAALYAVRAGFSTAVLERLSAGGQMALTHSIDNYPGFEEGIDGFELSERMRRQAERFGAETVSASVTSSDLSSSPKRITTDKGELHAKAVIIATGAGPRRLGLAGEEELVGRGVAYCAACDGMFYKGKTVVVVGGGNTAVEDALLLSRIADRVILVHRRDTLRATRIYHEPLMRAENVELRLNSTVERVIYGDKVTGVKIRDKVTDKETELSCDGVFVSIGRTPETELLNGQLQLDASGYIIADESTKTSIPGVFAAGDVRAKRLRQIVTAVSDGAVAAHMAEEYLSDIE